MGDKLVAIKFAGWSASCVAEFAHYRAVAGRIVPFRRVMSERLSDE
jgi:hypothetical protein